MDSHSLIVLEVALRLSIDPIVFKITTEGRHSFGPIISTSTHLTTSDPSDRTGKVSHKSYKVWISTHW